MDAIEGWLDSHLGADADLCFGHGKTACRKETIAMLGEGLEKRKPVRLSGKNGFQLLTRGFSKGADTENHLDRRLAWMFNFRTVFNAPPPILRPGSVLRKRNEDSDSFFVRMRPTCDSVRLRRPTTFLVLLLDDTNRKGLQMVLRTGPDEYGRFRVCTEMNRWLLLQLCPDQGREAVVADGVSPDFYFTDSDGAHYNWLGELKADFAQRIAQEFSSDLSRIGVNDSEWLRRETQRGN